MGPRGELFFHQQDEYMHHCQKKQVSDYVVEKLTPRESISAAGFTIQDDPDLAA